MILVRVAASKLSPLGNEARRLSLPNRRPLAACQHQCAERAQGLTDRSKVRLHGVASSASQRCELRQNGDGDLRWRFAANG